MTDGIVIGSDASQEWLLAWWWEHYSMHNQLPVAICDFGMSKEALQWCEQKGKVFKINDENIKLATKECLQTEKIEQWEKLYGNEVWSSRKAWFKKPDALLASPFDRTVWIDIDCEIRGDISSLFEYCENPSHLALVKEPNINVETEINLGQLLDKEILYNSGVVVFKKPCDLIAKWAMRARSENEHFWGDQSIISRIIHEEKIAIREMPDIYNFQMSLGINLQAIIIHWEGPWGKQFLKSHGGLTEHLKKIAIL